MTFFTPLVCSMSVRSLVSRGSVAFWSSCLRCEDALSLICLFCLSSCGWTCACAWAAGTPWASRLATCASAFFFASAFWSDSCLESWSSLDWSGLAGCLDMSTLTSSGPLAPAPNAAVSPS